MIGLCLISKLSIQSLKYKSLKIYKFVGRAKTLVIHYHKEAGLYLWDNSEPTIPSQKMSSRQTFTLAVTHANFFLIEIVYLYTVYLCFVNQNRRLILGRESPVNNSLLGRWAVSGSEFLCLCDGDNNLGLEVLGQKALNKHSSSFWFLV